MVTLTGIGCGTPEGLPAAAVQAIQEAEVVIGAKRMLQDLPAHSGEDVAAYQLEDILQILTERAPARCCVVYSGDPGFYSGAEGLIPALRARNIDFATIPGVSSLQQFAAKLGRSWKDWTLASAHGTDCDVVDLLRKGRPVFCLTGGPDGPAQLCRDLREVGLSHLAVTVGENLTYPHEQIISGTAGDFAERKFAPLNVALIDSPALYPARAPGLPDGAFIRGQTPMTKQEVRAAILAKLAVRPTDLCWDIGAGTGSVSVELAHHSRAVWAVEYDGEACSLIGQNRERFCAWNLRLVKGKAPAALSRLPAPHKVFIGGSEGALREILRQAVQRNPSVRVCVSAITLETVQEAMEEMEALGLDPELTQIAVSRTKKAGTKHLLLAQNPVFLLTGGRP